MAEDEQEPAESVPFRPEQALSTQGDVDRRRPGRLHYVSPWLIPLLRLKHPVEQVPAHQEHADEDQPADRDDDERDDNDLGVVQGIAFAVLLSIPFWVALAVFWYLG